MFKRLGAGIQLNIEQNITHFTFKAKHKVSGKSKDATEAVYAMLSAAGAWKQMAEDSQALLVDAVNRLERIQGVLDDCPLEERPDTIKSIQAILNEDVE